MKPTKFSSFITKKILTMTDYNKENGKVFWNKFLSKHQSKLYGKEAGKIMNGYRVISFSGRCLMVHRLIWRIENGVWPSGQIDHIDGNKLNNHISNLRDVSQSENLMNSHKHRKGHLAGTSYKRSNKKWVSQIKENKTMRHIGIFKTQIEAHNAYKQFLKEKTK